MLDCDSVNVDLSKSTMGEGIERSHHPCSPFKTAFLCLAVQFGLSLGYTTACFSGEIIDALRQMGVLGFLLLEDSQPTAQSTIDTSSCTIVAIWNQQHSLVSITPPQAVALLAVCPDKPNFEATSAAAHDLTPYHNLESSLAGSESRNGMHGGRRPRLSNGYRMEDARRQSSSAP